MWPLLNIWVFRESSSKESGQLAAAIPRFVVLVMSDSERQTPGMSRHLDTDWKAGITWLGILKGISDCCSWELTASDVPRLAAYPYVKRQRRVPAANVSVTKDKGFILHQPRQLCSGKGMRLNPCSPWVLLFGSWIWSRGQVLTTSVSKKGAGINALLNW